MKKTGIVLSGGGARSYAHLGLLQVLDESGIKPFAISGVSGGALVGALYASGKSPIEILEISKKSSLFGLPDFSWRGEGFFSMESIHKLLEEHIPHNSFENLQIPLFVNATDFNHNITVFFSKGKLIECLLASASVPVIFNPVEVNNAILVDGGLLNNLPVEPLLDICDIIIGSHVNKLETFSENKKKLSKMAILERCFHLSIASTVYSRGLNCDLLLEPNLFPFGIFDIKDADAIYEEGYRNALQHIKDIEKLAT